MNLTIHLLTNPLKGTGVKGYILFKKSLQTWETQLPEETKSELLRDKREAIVYRKSSHPKFPPRSTYANEGFKCEQFGLVEKMKIRVHFAYF